MSIENMDYKNDIPRVLNVYNEYRLDTDEYVSLFMVMGINPDKFQGDFYKNLHEQLTNEGLRRQSNSVKSDIAIIQSVTNKINDPYFSMAFAVDVLKYAKEKDIKWSPSFYFNNDHEIVCGQPMFKYSLSLNDYITMKALNLSFYFAYQLDRRGNLQYRYLSYDSNPIHNTAFMLRFEPDEMQALFERSYRKYPTNDDDDDEYDDDDADDDDDDYVSTW